MNIEDKHAGVLGHASDDPELLRQCAASGQMSAAQMVQHSMADSTPAGAFSQIAQIAIKAMEGAQTSRPANGSDELAQLRVRLALSSIAHIALKAAGDHAAQTQNARAAVDRSTRA